MDAFSVFDENDADAIVEWVSSIDTEIVFWCKWFETKGLQWPDDYERRTAGKIEFAYPEIAAGKDKIKALDVGSGPISRLGNIAPGTVIELSACDPLAFVYKEILDKAGVRPYVESQFALTERLCDAYPKNSFDIVNMTNALDHSINPVLGIFNMLAVCKKEGTVVLHHRENEAEFEDYSGLHQWNISEASGDLIIWNRSKRINITDILGENADVEVSRIGDGSQKLDTYIRAYITKRHECEFSTAGLNIYDQVFAKTAFYVMSEQYRNIAANEGIIERIESLSRQEPRRGFIAGLKSVFRKY